MIYLFLIEKPNFLYILKICFPAIKSPKIRVPETVEATKEQSPP